MNVHTGGGATLLDGLLAADANFENVVLIVDNRYVPVSPLPEGLEVRRVVPSVLGRIKAATWVARTARPGDRLICLGNLPPLLGVRCAVVVYIQNRYIIDYVPTVGFPFAVATRLLLERLWLRWRSGCVDRFVVQTSSMRCLLEEAKLAKGRPVDILPFIGNAVVLSGVPPDAARDGFLYVASGEPHKNHLLLLDAWRLLAEDGLFPQLRLTLDAKRFPALLAEIIEVSSAHGLDIVNLGRLQRETLMGEYSRAAALVYPSSFESLGMPLIEASQFGLPIIAPELDYVRDVAVPAESFDPTSTLSLARAVKRFLGREEQLDRPLAPDAFLHRLWYTNDAGEGQR
jgi:glycosyltransferase involved in cell wall biosynthesis